MFDSIREEAMQELSSADETRTSYKQGPPSTERERRLFNFGSNIVPYCHQ